jgi:glutamate N-acetyltransferase/amino-acid N-acetyltransferase
MANQTITAPTGFRAGSAAAGIKTGGELDVGVLAADRSSGAAAVFTRNRFCGAPIIVGREHIRRGALRAIVVNSGCPNVATGRRGVTDARAMCRQVADVLDVPAEEVLPASTGVIGEFLPMPRIRVGIDQSLNALSPTARAGRRFAQAIMTTDTKTKQACRRVQLGRRVVTVAGCCKGSGMIAPNMATMLAYLTTDAGLPPGRLQRLLHQAADVTFNRVSVDACQSTSDMAVLMASGCAGRLSSSKHLRAFARALTDVCDSLAYQLVADGEGATRVLEVLVTGGKSEADAQSAARSIASSPLVKTALHGADPNWGRIVQALGQSSARYHPSKVVVQLGSTVLFRNGTAVRNLDVGALRKLMRCKHVTLTVNLRAGRSRGRMLTCDLSHGYITINAHYHT